MVLSKMKEIFNKFFAEISKVDIWSGKFVFCIAISGAVILGFSISLMSIAGPSKILLAIGLFFLPISIIMLLAVMVMLMVMG